MTNFDKRVQKYSMRENCSFSCVRPYFIYPWATPIASCKIVYNVCHNFFFLQWRQKFHLTHRPVINVNTKTDEKIPFSPEYVRIYLSFVQFFIKPFDLIYKRLGLIKGRKYASRSICFISNLYKNAASIYKFSMSTTPRPNYKESKEFRTIHGWDPHYLCVPSLHVAIASGVYIWYKQLFQEMIQQNLISQEEADRRSQEFRREGISIIESVLFVKQHSVNCIPTALYMVSRTMEENGAKAVNFESYIHDIFAGEDSLSPETKKELQEYFSSLYNKLMEEGTHAEQWQTPVKRWIVYHANDTRQSMSKPHK